MELPAPTSLDEILVDGSIAQAASSYALAQACDPLLDISFNPVPGGYQVKFRSERSQTVLFGVSAAHIHGKQWQWRQEYAFDIPELRGTQEGSDALLRAARTLNGNGPGYFVPLEDGSFDLVIISDALPELPLDTALTLGLGAVENPRDLPRAMMAFAAEHSLGFEQRDGAIVVEDEQQRVQVDLGTGQIASSMQLVDVLSDAFYYSTEHQLFYEGQGLPAVVEYNAARGETPYGNAMLIATIRAGKFRWSFDHAPGKALQQFAIDQHLSALLKPSWDVHEAEQLFLENAAKPVLNSWTHAFCQLDADTMGLLFFNQPASPLPPLSKAAAMATLQAPIPDALDARRSLEFYASKRGARLLATDQHTAELECEDGRVLISFEADRIVAVHDAFKMGA
ncbi:DUF6882 domain-containing protein [Corynebacterium pseudopelargi]|uniref:Uncharacterized protein n=1 Tax=Corynebacterium pseudopelargi TaxID=2080757 RepID=A0A3G6IVM5_9CORY|nr:DUF6882 domain-containing protein [Corynebacterium pseudopelargi]AZA09643.1 hypothetical protein CPPEL_07675 [Corynebacterium pseudopelargi]